MRQPAASKPIFAAAFVIAVSLPGMAVASDPEPAGAAVGREDSVASARELYAERQYDPAIQQLDKVLAADPSNESALLLSGLADLRVDDPAKAAVAWGRYVQVSSDPRMAENVGRMRTIVLREAAERAARDAVAHEKDMTSATTNPRAVAVTTFRNAGSPEFESFGKAVAAMLIDNLSALPSVTVLEREQVQALEAEARLGQGGLVEKGTAVRAGKLLRAGRVGAGGHLDWTASPTHLKLEALLVDVDGGATLAEAKSEAFASEFYKLVPEIAGKFAGSLGQPAARLSTSSRGRLQQEHTHSLPAALAFGRALDALDRHDAKGAREACKEVEREDPNFELAKRTCAFVPLEWLSLAGVIAALEPASTNPALQRVGIGLAGATGVGLGIAAGVGAFDSSEPRALSPMR